MQSMLKISVGVALLVAGVIGLTLGYGGDNALIIALSWAALLIGAGLLVFGISVYRKEQKRPQQPQYTDLEKRMLIQSMACVANADGKVRDIEVVAICNIHEQLLHMPVSQKEVHDIIGDTTSKEILKGLKTHADDIGDHMKRIIIQSCQLIMISDSEVVNIEENRIHEIGKAIGLKKNHVDELIAVFST